VVTSISQENPGVVTVLDEHRIPFEDGDWVTFSEVQGMTQLNGSERQIKILSPYTFSIEDTTGYSPYKTGGHVTQVKKPARLNFVSLKESLQTPGEFLISDFAKFERPPHLHLGFQAVAEFQKKHKNLPGAHNEEHGQEVVAIAKEINAKLPNKLVEEVDEKLIKLLAYTSSGELPPISAFLGGFAAQEVLKACSGKFSPVKQWFYFDATEVLPKEDLPASEFQPTGTRYDAQIVCLGKSLHQKVTELSYFVVGAGAIGCEVLKNFAMLGIGTGKNAMVHVTDMDVIEKSNLSRQFLFRPKDVEQLKSTTAANAVKQMNPQFNIKSYANRVGADTETIFNSAFYNSLSGVCNALDNVEARMYMDSQCIFYKKPLLESGTLGTKGNTQVVVPHLTESYASSRDPPEKTIPMCTLHHFPNSIEHTIQWARDTFEGMFHNQPETVNSYLTISNFMESLHKQSTGIKLDTLQTLKRNLVDEKPTTFDQCVAYARLKFEEYFNNNIQQLLYNFPLDMVTSTGAPFWSGPKRAPKPLKFDVNDVQHYEFILACANLRAQLFGIQGTRDAGIIKKALSHVAVPEFVPKKGIKINTDENAKDEKKEPEPVEDDDDTARKLIEEIPPPSKLSGFKLNVIEFEKDVDTNFHIDFITAAANLRAGNYSIPPADKHKCKGIAGKIIPAMITTTAVVSALVCIELLKIHQNRPIEELKNGFVNLALPFVAFSEPLKPPTTKIRDGWEWTLWDRFEVDGELTLQEFIEHFKQKYQLEVTMVSCGVAMVFAFFMGKDKLAERMPKKLSEVVALVNKQAIPENRNHLTLEICVNRIEDDEEVDVPFVKYTFRK
jgi:ubiquitin-activating enzyme E1